MRAPAWLLWLASFSGVVLQSIAGVESQSHARADADDPLLVRTARGYVRGIARDGYRVFRGIPYAAPPVGDLRWRPPQTHLDWEDVFNATDFGPTCLRPQLWWSDDATWQSEDCLSINVLTPEDTSKLYPVMFYIHSGEFHAGSSNDLESNWPYFASDIVFVSLNFRVGVFGFLASEDLRPRHPSNGTGNYGLLDQRFALEWVQTNIQAFGGNPQSVTIWGESSGGTSVAYHLTAYGQASTDLFQRAILQSPGLTQVKTWADAVENYEYLVAALTAANSELCAHTSGYVSFNSTEIFNDDQPQPLRVTDNETEVDAAEWCDKNADCIAFTRYGTNTKAPGRTVYTAKGLAFYPYSKATNPKNVTLFMKRGPADSAAKLACILNADGRLLESLTEDMPRDDTFQTDTWAPVIDGVDLPEPILSRVSQGLVAAGVDILAGTNLDEGTEFMQLTPSIGCDATEADLLKWCDDFFGPDMGPQVPGIYLSNLERPLPVCGEGNEPTDIPGEQAVPWMTAMRSAGDAAIRCPTWRLAMIAGRRSHGHTFIYHFQITPTYSVNVGKNTSAWGAWHGAEVPFVFGDAFELENLLEQSAAKAMGCMWRNFAYYGYPRSELCVGFHWPPFAVTGEYLQIRPNSSMKIVTGNGNWKTLCEILDPDGPHHPEEFFF